MIIAVSIVDKHKPGGERHVGTYMFEIDYPINTHFDFKVFSNETEEAVAPLRPYLNRLLSQREIEAMDANAREAMS